ncbi:MAG: AAA family ATPase [Anaerolineae bacterium]|nr:AAA family ATPase [Anaerolineae bacterium]
MTTQNPDLFAHSRDAQIERESPLANRMRPRTLDEFAGQRHIIGPGRLLRRAIEADQLSSLIFYGPPGTGKTTLAMVIANTTESQFVTLNAVLDGVKQLRDVIADAEERRGLYGRRTTLFVDEVHRWNKAQQDALLPHVERGTIILIGATTENPYFEVNKALVSRSRIFQLRPLTNDDLRDVALRAVRDKERGYGNRPITLHDDALDHLVDVANGDARSVLNALELAVESTPLGEDGVITIDLGVAEESIQRRAVLYDKDGDVHYDTISAFIKSLRGSDPDAALYWMAKMIYAGEDPRFIFRRMAILAGEDIGMADPQAAVVVDACWSLFERIGLPEGQFPLTQAALYLATAPKSNTALSFFDALATVQQEREADVPNHLKDGNRDKEGFGHGEGYRYPHAYQEHWVAQQYLPGALQGKVFYEPSGQGYEKRIKLQVERRREEQLAALADVEDAHLEMWTTSPTDRARDRWLERAVAGTGRQLGALRDRLFAAAQMQRHHLVLDVKADDGLLLWEAVRIVPEGGVWAVVTPEGRENISGLATRLPELERPHLLSDLDSGDVRFDRIIGRNAFTHLHNQTGLIDRLHSLLLPDGKLCLLQIVPRRGQRLHELIDWAGETVLQQKVAAAEELLWSDSADTLVNWDIADLEAALLAQFTGIHIEKIAFQETRRITQAQLDRWFGSRADTTIGSYAQKLVEAGLNGEEVATIGRMYRRALQDQMVTWHSLYVLAVADYHVA